MDVTKITSTKENKTIKSGLGKSTLFAGFHSL
jgi:hypothetical protein